MPQIRYTQLATDQYEHDKRIQSGGSCQRLLVYCLRTSGDELQLLLLLCLMPGSWDGMVITVHSSFGDTKLTFKVVSDLIIGNVIYMKNSSESSSSGFLLSMYGTCRKAKSGMKSQAEPKEVQCWTCQIFGISGFSAQFRR